MYKSKYKIVAWFKNYWYYYKIPFIIAGCALILVVWFVVEQVTRVESDARLYVITDAALIEEQYRPLESLVTEYTGDFNGDKHVTTAVSYLNLAKEATNEVQIAAYQQILTIFYDKSVSVLLVDQHAYEYLRNSEGLATLADYGVTGGIDEYRVPVEGTRIDETVPWLKAAGDMYLVFRICPEAQAGEPTVIACYEGMARLVQDIADEYQALS